MVDAGVRKALEDLLSLKQRTAEGITRRKPTVAATSGFLTKKVSLDGLLMNFFFFFSPRRFERAIRKRTKHGQVLGREKYFARNTTSSQRKRSCAAK